MVAVERTHGIKVYRPVCDVSVSIYSGASAEETRLLQSQQKHFLKLFEEGSVSLCVDRWSRLLESQHRYYEVVSKMNEKEISDNCYIKAVSKKCFDQLVVALKNKL